MMSALKGVCARALRVVANVRTDNGLAQQDRAANAVDRDTSYDDLFQTDGSNDRLVVPSVLIGPFERIGPFRFLQLPAELRNQVYSFVLTKHDSNGNRVPIGLTQPALTRVSHSVRSETLHLFYSSNHFSLNISVFPANIDLRSEEHERLRFLRGIQHLVRAGHCSLIDQLAIFYFTHIEDQAGTVQCVGLSVQLHKKRPIVYDNAGFPEDLPQPEQDHDWYWKFQRLGDDYTNWSDIENLDFAVEIQKRIWMSVLMIDAPHLAPFVIDLPTGRLCEVLHILLRRSSHQASPPAGPNHFLFAQGHDFEL